ncbi:MAG: adenylate kinase family protein [Candidatus Ranarchaeia archaeon]|jgi:adenylate kinase
MTGTPGVGKTVVSKELGRILDVPVIHLGEMLLLPHLQKDLIAGQDSQRGSFIVKPAPLKRWIRREVSHLGPSIIESHFTDLVPPELVSHCVILRCHPESLQARLEGRKWSLQKIQENIQAELLGNCAMDVIQAFKKHEVVFHEIDSSGNDVNQHVQLIINCIQASQCATPEINWLRTLNNQQLKLYFGY